jgi:hypothetical protein
MPGSAKSSLIISAAAGNLVNLSCLWGLLLPYLLSYLRLKDTVTITQLQITIVLISFAEFSINMMVYDFCRILGISTTIRIFLLLDALTLWMLGSYNNIMVVYFFGVIFGFSMGIFRNLHPYVTLGHFP